MLVPWGTSPVSSVSMLLRESCCIAITDGWILSRKRFQYLLIHPSHHKILLRLFTLREPQVHTTSTSHLPPTHIHTYINTTLIHSLTNSPSSHYYPHRHAHHHLHLWQHPPRQATLRGWNYLMKICVPTL